MPNLTNKRIWKNSTLTSKSGNTESLKKRLAMNPNLEMEKINKLKIFLEDYGNVV